MKYAILFAFAAFAFLAQANAETIALNPKLDRGAIVNALKEKLAAAKAKLETMLDKAEDALKAKITEAKEKAEHLIEQLRDKAHEISEQVFQAAQEILDKMTFEMIPKSHPAEDLSECMAMKDTFRQSVLSLIANSTSCVNDKIEEAQSYVMDIYVRSWKSVEEVKTMKEQGKECTKEIDGIRKLTAAVACVTKVTTKGSFFVAKQIPAVSMDATKLVTEISTLRASLTFCMSKNILLTIAEEAKPVAVSIKNCIKEKIKKPEA